MFSKDTEILEFNQYQKSWKPLFFIYTDLKYLLEKIEGCDNNHENSSTRKARNIFRKVFQCLQYSNLEKTKHKHDVYKVKDCLKKFCESLREHRILILKIKNCFYEQKSSRNHMNIQNSFVFVKKSLKIDMWKIKNIFKLEIIVIIQKNKEAPCIAYEIENIGYLKKIL